MVKKNLISLAIENAEVIFDQILDDGLVRDIPIINTVANVIAVGKSVRDTLFARKLARFLNEINNISDADYEKIRAFALSEDSEEISEKLLNVLDANSEVSKSEIIANVFLGFVDKKLTAHELKGVLEIIEKSYSSDLNNFLKTLPVMSSNIMHLQRGGISNLVNTPLIEQKPRTSLSLRTAEDSWKQKQESQEIYRTTPIGTQFRNAYLHGISMRGKNAAKSLVDPISSV